MKRKRNQVVRGRRIACIKCKTRVVAVLPWRCRGCGRMLRKRLIDMATTERAAYLRNLSVSSWRVSRMSGPTTVMTWTMQADRPDGSTWTVTPPVAPRD